MRSLPLVLVLAACSGGGDGAVLTFTATDAPTGVGRIELVLASASPDSITATRQRQRPGMPHEEDVVYYRQRSSVDAITGISSLAGFEVRIEPDEALVPDETFIPFALIYDQADVLIAVGTVNDAAGEPSAVMIKPGVVAAYDVTVVALAPDVDTAGVGVGQGHAVVCDGVAGSWRSGAVWKRASGPQIRLLLPDLAADPAATDAMLRGSDLDCDQYPADDRDCDDLRTAYHAGQVETCDGQDTDCDGRRMELVEGCASPTNLACSATGVSLCTEAPTETAAAGACLPTAACGCASTGGSIPAGCAVCSLGWVTAPNGAMACAPAVGKLHIEQCDTPGCTVDVVGIDGPWEVKIAPEEVGPFAARLPGISTGYVYLRAKYLGTAPFPANTISLGAAYIAVVSGQGRPIMTSVNLDFADGVMNQCTPGSSGNNPMQCQP